MISIPYYNWKYARENGFWSWLVLGQIVPTLQSAIWPYYVVSSLFERGWTQQEMENLAHLKRSGTAYVKAKIFFEGFEKTGKAPPAEAAKAVELLNEALTEPANMLHAIQSSCSNDLEERRADPSMRPGWLRCTLIDRWLDIVEQNYPTLKVEVDRIRKAVPE
jgi:hypothetical protein